MFPQGPSGAQAWQFRLLGMDAGQLGNDGFSLE